MNGTRTEHPGHDDFGAFMDALRQRFGGDDQAPDSDLLVLLDDEVDAPAARADVDDPIAEPELPIELAPQLLSWRRLGAELAVGFGSVAVLEVALGTGIGSPGIAPHPYWLVVLPIAAARGFVAGILTALVATVLILLGAGANLQAGQELALLSYEHGVQPLALLLGAFVVGQIADGVAARQRELWRRLTHQSEEFARSAGATRRLLRSNRELKVRLLDHRAQFGHLLEAARRLESATREDLYAVALDMIAEHCAADRCSVVTFAGEDLVVLASHGWDGEDEALAESTRQSDVVREAWESGGRFDAFRIDRTQAQGPLLVLPLEGADGTRLALLCLDSMPADRYHQGLASIFFGIGDWTQTGLDRLRKGERLDLTQPDVGTALQAGNQVGTTAALRLRLHREQGRLDRGAPVSLLTIRAIGNGAWTPNDLQRLDKLIDATVLNGVVRSSDGVYRLPTPGTWMVVLPHTPQLYAPVVQQQIDKFLRPLSFGRICGFEIDIVQGEDMALRRAAEIGAKAAVSTHDPATSEPVCLMQSERTWSDAKDMAARIRVEGALAHRRDTPMFAVMLGFDPEWIPPTRGEEAVLAGLETGTDALASFHRLGPGRLVVLMPESEDAEAFALADALMRHLSAAAPSAPPSARIRHVRATTGQPGELTMLLRGLLGDWEPSDEGSALAGGLS